MLNVDLFQSQESRFPRWDKHEYITFSSPQMMLNWISEDSKSLAMSHKVFDSVIYCLENDLDGVIPMTLIFESQDSVNPNILPESVKNQVSPDDKVYVMAHLDIEIIKENFQVIIEKYIERLLENEQYERIATVVPTLNKYGYNIPM